MVTHLQASDRHLPYRQRRRSLSTVGDIYREAAYHFHSVFSFVPFLVRSKPSEIQLEGLMMYALPAGPKKEFQLKSNLLHLA